MEQLRYMMLSVHIILPDGKVLGDMQMGRY